MQEVKMTFGKNERGKKQQQQQREREGNREREGRQARTAGLTRHLQFHSIEGRNNLNKR